MSLRLVLLADTHGVLDGRIAALAADADYVVHAGDVGAAQVLRALKPRRQLLVVAGNNDTPDKWPEQDRDQLEALPEQGQLALPGGKLSVEHGDRVLPAKRRHDLLRQRHPSARAVVYGHSHRLCLDCEAEPWVLNPGAAGRARTFGGPSCIVLDIHGDSWELTPRRFPLA